jgi:hypothetical protein
VRVVSVCVVLYDSQKKISAKLPFFCEMPSFPFEPAWICVYMLRKFLLHHEQDKCARFIEPEVKEQTIIFAHTHKPYACMYMYIFISAEFNTCKEVVFMLMIEFL